MVNSSGFGVGRNIRPFKVVLMPVQPQRFGVGRNIGKLSRGNRFNLEWKNRTLQVFTQAA